MEVDGLLPDGRVGATLPDGRHVRIAATPGLAAVPGDVVRAQPTGGSGRTVDAALIAVVTPSRHRVAPPCPHSAACGGCDLDALAPDVRGRALARTVARAFRWEGDVPFVPSPTTGGWRARIKLAIDGAALGYRAARSHALVPVDVCRIARPEIAALHGALARWLADDPRRGDGLAEVELRSDGVRAIAAFRSAPGRRSPMDRAALAELGDVALDGRRLHGDPTLVLTSGDLRLRASPNAFFQVHLGLNDTLVEHVRELVMVRGAERVLDLYAGIGNLGLPLARHVPVVAVEAPGAGAEDLRHNVTANGLSGTVEVVAVTAERFDPSRTPFDTVILDPPRAGAPGVIDRVARNRPHTIVYVSCHAPSAARDLRGLDGKYRLVGLTAIDLFPQTHHVEAIAVLERAGR